MSWARSFTLAVTDPLRAPTRWFSFAAGVLRSGQVQEGPEGMCARAPVAHPGHALILPRRPACHAALPARTCSSGRPSSLCPPSPHTAERAGTWGHGGGAPASSPASGPAEPAPRCGFRGAPISAAPPTPQLKCLAPELSMSPLGDLGTPSSAIFLQKFGCSAGGFSHMAVSAVSLGQHH